MSISALTHFRYPTSKRSVSVRWEAPDLEPLLHTFYTAYRCAQPAAHASSRLISLSKQDDGEYRLTGPSGVWYSDGAGHAAAHYEAELTDALVTDAGDFVRLHGSAVYTDADCLLLLGPSGAGKSTLTLGLCIAGMSMLADDAIMLDPRDGRVQLFERSLRVHEVGVEGLNLVGREVAAAVICEPYLWVGPDVFAGEGRTERSPTALLFLEPAEAAELEALTVREALQRLLVARHDAGEPTRDFECLSRMAEEVPGYRLGVGKFSASVERALDLTTVRAG